MNFYYFISCTYVVWWGRARHEESFLGACVKIPETGKSVLLVTTPSFENQLGNDGYKEILSKAKISKNTRLNKILKRVGSRIAAQTNRKDFKSTHPAGATRIQNLKKLLPQVLPLYERAARKHGLGENL